MSSSFPSCALWLTSLALAACASVGPDYQTPPTQTPAQWHNADSPTASPAPLSQWWKQLNDDTLNALLAHALEKGPDLRLAKAKILEARAQRGVTEAGAYPSVNGGGSAQRTGTLGDGDGDNSFRLGLDASWEIDLFGGTRRSIEAAKATEAARVEEARDAQVTLVAEVAKTYLDLRTQQARLVIARANATSQAETEQLTRWRTQAGSLSQLELAQARSSLEQTRARAPQLESTIEADLNALAVLCGIPRQEVASLLKGEGQIPAIPASLGVSVPAEVLRQRPDVRAAERKLAAQTANIGVATAELYPALKLSGSIGLASDHASELLRIGSGSTSLLAGLTVPVFDAGRVRRNIAVQNALQEQSLISYEKAVSQALSDVESGLAALAKSRERSSSLRQAVDAADLAEDIARQRFTAGLIDFASMLETQRDRLSAEDQYVSGLGDQASALVQLYKALGGGWQTDEPAPAATPGVSPQ